MHLLQHVCACQGWNLGCNSLTCYVTGVDEVELTFADEVWNSVQYSCYKFCVDGVKLVQMGGGYSMYIFNSNMSEVCMFQF